MIVNLPRPIAVVCHDAGSANHIVAWLRTDGIEGSVRAFMTGPAEAIWENNFPGVMQASSLLEAISGSASLLSGTGWSSAIEHEARVLARKNGLNIAAMVDHWVNYEIRFERASQRLLPDEIWVVDEYAETIATTKFPECKISRKPDEYSRRLVEKISPVSEVESNELLYVLEPARTSWGKDKLGEFQALDFMLESLSSLGLPEDLVVCLRAHPSDRPGKYDHYRSQSFGYQLKFDTGDLGDALSRARWVAGCNSFALTLALAAGRTVYCSLPPWAAPCCLPHEGLVHVKESLAK